MHRTAVRTALVLLASTALVAVASPALAGGHPAEHAKHHPPQQVVTVTGTGSSVQLSTHHAYAGSIHFVVSSTNKVTEQGGGSEITLFRLKDDKTLKQFFAALQEEFSQTPAVAAKGTRDLVATVIARGLADVVPGYPETVTETLEPGRYYAMDLGSQPSGPPALTPFTVLPSKHASDDSDVRSQVWVKTVDEHFIAPKVWPHEGTYTFVNRSDTLHFMALQPVKPGTTDAQIQQAFDMPPSQQAGPPPFMMQGPSGGNDVVSPGYSLQVTYDLPPGTYVLLCFVADDVTGMPHAAMGMHEVVVLK